MEQRDDPLAELPDNVSPHTLSSHVVLVGFGRVGLHIAKSLDAQALPNVVAEQQREAVEKLRGRAFIRWWVMRPNQRY